MDYHRFSNYPAPINNFINIVAIASVILFGSFYLKIKLIVGQFY